MKKFLLFVLLLFNLFSQCSYESRQCIKEAVFAGIKKRKLLKVLLQISKEKYFSDNVLKKEFRDQFYFLKSTAQSFTCEIFEMEQDLESLKNFKSCKNSSEIFL